MKSPDVFVIVSFCTAKFSSVTLPVPLALMSKSAFVLLDCITFPVILILSICASWANKVFQFLVGLPKSYVVSILGIKLESMPADIVISSVASSPIVTLPPIVMSPITERFPLTSTLSLKTVLLPNESNVKSPDVVVIVLPDSFTFPVSIELPEITVTSDPVVNVSAWSTSMFKFALVKSTCPVFWSTLNWSPTLKSPLWSTELKNIFAPFVATTSLACITVFASLSTW